MKWSLAITLAAALPAMAQVANTWNGGGADDNWTTASNWSPGAPSAGDSLIFDGSTRTTPNNDFTADTGFGGIQFAPTASAFTLGGNRIAFAGLIENATTNTLQTIALPLLLTNATTFNTISNDDTTTDDLQVIGGVSGAGSLTKTGGATMFLSSASHSGGTTVSAGALVVSNNIGNVSLGGGTYMMNFRTYFINPTISLTADSSLGVNLLDNAEPVGVDTYSTIGTAGYKLTKVGVGLLRSVGSINASSIDVAEGTLASLGGGVGGSVSVEPPHKLGTAPITVENGAMLRIDDGGVVGNAITLMGGDGTSVGGSQHTGILRSSARNNGGSTTNFNYFTNTITVMVDSTIGSYYNKMFISGNLTGPGGFTKIGAQPLNISGTNTLGGSLIVSAGTLQLGSSVALASGATNGYVQVANSATLDLNGNNASCNGFLDDGVGTATLDNTASTPATLTFGNNSASATFYGAVKNTGGGPLSLVYVGGGTASFLGVNTYSGSNVVSAGTLDINIPTGTTNGGMVYVADTATLSLHYRVPGSSLRASGATFGASGATSLTIDLNNYGNPTPPVINATNGSGVLSANGTITITFNNTANLSVGTFPIIRYTTRTGGGNFVLNPISGIGAKIITNTAAGNNYIGLQITNAPITTWKGKTNNNLWDLTTTNWTYSGAPVLYSDGSAVFFDDTALTNNVNLTTAVFPGSVLLNSTNTYIFSGPGSLSGGSLTKNGSGTLILDVLGNSHASTTIGGGTLQVGNHDSNGDLGSGNVDDQGTLVFSLTNNYIVPGVISGAGSVVQNDTNIVTLSQANTYTGGTLVNQGVLKLGNNTALGVPTGLAASVASGASLDLGGKLFSGPGYISISGNGISANSGALMTSAGMGCTIGCGGVGAKFLRLAGNATIGDSSGDFLLGLDGNANGSAAGVGSIDGQGFSLTKVGNNTLVLDATNVTALSQFVIAGGQVLYANTGKTPFGTTATLVISNNTYMDAWDNFANSGITVANNIVIGTGGGQLWNTRGMFYGQACRNTYSGSVTLNANLALRNTSTYGGAPNNVATSGTMTFSGPISGPGGINCTNGNLYTVGSSTSINTVTLSGANTYTGTTLVNQGVLQLSPIQQGGGSYVLNDNSTLDVPTQNGFSTVPMSSLTLGSVNGGTLSLSRVTSLSTVTVPIYATNLTVVGTNAILLPAVAYASGAGTYPLIKYTTGPSGYGVTGLIAIGGGVRGVTGYITNDTANSQIAFVIPGGTPVIWAGSSNPGIWDIATSLNWTTNAVSTVYQQSGSLGDVVTFNDSSTQTNVNVSVPVAPTSAIFNTTNSTYTLFGTNLTGAASLVKNGPGMLVLSNRNNNYTGGTVVNGGTLRLGFSPTTSFFNSFAGPVTVASGASLDMGSNNPTGLTINASGAGVAGAGAIQANYPSGAQAFGPSIINQIGNLTIGGTNRWDFRNGSKTWNVNSNGATLTKVGPNYIGLVGASVSTNLGDITILGGTFSYQTSTAGLGNTNGTVYVGSSGTFGFFGATVPLVKNIVFSNGASILVESGNALNQNVFAGPVTLASGTTTVKGNFFNGLVFSNTISGPGSLSLQFQSYVYLAASNTFTGQVTVPNCGASNGGRGTRLSLVGSGSITKASQIYLQGVVSGQPYAGWLGLEGRPDATLTLGSGQLLRGDNDSFIRGSVVAPATSMIAPGGINNSNYQFMTVGTNLTLQAGSTNYMDIYKTASLRTNDLIIVSNLVTYGGTLQIRTNGPTALIVGDTFKLFQAGSVSGNFANIADDSGTSWSFNPATGVATVTGLPPTVNTNSTNITVSVSGLAMTLQWPADHIGWFLQSNSVGLSSPSSWFNVVGSDVTNKVVINVNPSLTNVFYRMKY